MIKPMLAVKVDWDKIERRCAGYSMELKLDGVRGVVLKDVHGINGVRIHSRSGQDLTAKLPYLAEMFRQVPGSFIIDGELGYTTPGSFGDLPIIDFNKTMRVIGSGPSEAIRKQEENAAGSAYDSMSKQIRFHAFDILHTTIRDVSELRQYDRHMLLSDWRWEHANDKLLPVEFFDVADWWPQWNEDIYTKYVNQGGEGIILKNPVGRYVEGKRPANVWYKVKKFESIDVQIKGYTSGEGKYAGQIGAIVFEYDGRTFKCSGMDDATRAAISAAPIEHLHRWIEVRHFGFVGEDGLRFPQFLRFRPDKEST